MAMVPMPVEQVHEGTCRQQQVRENPKQMGPVFCQQEKERDRKKSGQNRSGPAGHAAVFKAAWLMHGDLPVGLPTGE